MTDIPQLIEWGYWLVPWSRNPRKPMVRDWQKTKPNAHGFHIAYRDEIDWAIVPRDGVVVLDIEMKGGLNGERDFSDIYGREPDSFGIWLCPAARTKSGGLHLWFRQPAGKELVGGHHIRPGIEAKAITGSVHIPPSVGYSWLSPLVALDCLPELPPCLVDAWEKSAKVKTSCDRQYKAETYSMGERRARLCSMAGRLRSAGLTETELAAALLAIRDNRCEDPSTFTDAEIVGIAKDYARKPDRTQPDTSWFPASQQD